MYTASPPPNATMTKTIFFIFMLSLLHCALSSTAASSCQNSSIQFSFNGHSFMTDRNLQICFSYMESVALDPAIDDYGKYLSAKAAALAMSNQTGASIKLANGIYPVKTAIILPSNVCLLGTSRDYTVIKVVENATDSAPVRGVIRSVNTTRVTVRSLTVNCNRIKQNNIKAKEHFAKFGLFFEATNYTYIKNVRVLGALGYGFDPHGSAFARGNHVAIENCIADSCHKVGFKISRMNYATVVESIALNSGCKGIDITKGSQKVSVEANIVADSGYLCREDGCGIIVEEKDDQWPTCVRLLNNRIHNAYNGAVCLDQAMGVDIEKTCISNNVDSNSHCFKFRKSERLTAVSNECNGPEGKQIHRDGGENPSERCMGLPSDGACCPSVCGTCGGDGCGSRFPVRGCCASDIKADNKPCIFNDPPCVM